MSGLTPALTGCHSLIGPHSVAADRFDYSTAIADSWKQQTLLTSSSSATLTCRCSWMCRQSCRVNRDWQTKRSFTAIMFLFTMAENGGEENCP